MSEHLDLMPILAHLAAERDGPSIRRSGIKAGHVDQGMPSGVFCMPILPNHLVSHQWLRELKRRGHRTVVAIDFRLSSAEPVWFGHYGHPHEEMSLGRAIGTLRKVPDPLGFEVIVPRSIFPTRSSESAGRVRFSAGGTTPVRTVIDRPAPAGCACPKGRSNRGG